MPGSSGAYNCASVRVCGAGVRVCGFAVRVSDEDEDEDSGGQ